MHIAVAGNIGAGKTTLTGLLAHHYGWEAQFEEVDENPYLSDFYEDMERWAFNLQVYFFFFFLNGIVAIKNAKQSVIQDRTIYEDACIFATNLHSMGLMSTRDYTNYRSLFDLMMSLVAPPDLIIYLKASVPTLVSQIQKRGREYEAGIRLDYLSKLNDFYNDWINKYVGGKKLIIDVDVLKFSEKAEDLSIVIDKVNAELHGLF
jgi:deoxyadenosine/deoxycytidine kinase